MLLIHIFLVTISDRPRAPVGPLNVLDIFKDRCHLRWLPPLDDGGLNLDYYLVESRDTDTMV